MREPCRSQSHLAQSVALPARTEHGIGGHHAIVETYLAMIAPAGHRVDVADDFEAGIGQVDYECGIARLRRVGIGIGARDHDGELCAVRTRDKPFVSVDYPIVALLFG